MTIVLRPCREQDINAVLALWQRAKAVPRPTDTHAGLLLRLQRDRELFVLAWADDELVGSLLGGWDGWRGNMYRLVVAPEFRRMGVARRMVEEVEVALRRLGAERITSLVFVDEPGAVETWTGAGYTLDPATARYAKDLRRSSG